MSNFSIISAPTHLGLWPSGVQELCATLLDHGISQRLCAPVVHEVRPSAYVREKDHETGYLNGPAIRSFTVELANAVASLRLEGRVPIVLGGDCSVVLGGLVALRRTGQPSLFYLDGHQDFYDGSGTHSGEVADMGLGIATGHMHSLLSDIEGLGPYVRPSDAVAFGYRDEDEIAESGGRSFDGIGIPALGLNKLRWIGLERGLKEAIGVVAKPESSGIWLHFDTDVVDDGLNPAVDYRLPGGLSWNDCSTILRAVRQTQKLAGVSVSIFNPRKDHDGRIAMALTECLVSGLRD